jgi:hypothetical protein
LKAPVFIVGAPRSGTTLTARIVGGHPDIYIPGEGYFFDDIYSSRKELGELPDLDVLKKIYNRLMDMYGRYNMLEDQERVEDLSKGPLDFGAFSDCSDYKDILNVFMGVQTREAGKLRWGNHTPRDLYNIDDILSFYPDAHIIACVRDPRDFMLSYKEKWKVRKGMEAVRLKSLYHPVITSLQWKSSMEKILGLEKKVPPENLTILKYEDLVTEPDKMVRNLCAGLKEKFYPDMLNVSCNNSSAINAGQKGIFSSSVGKWREELSHIDVAVMQIIAGKEMELAGYEIENVPSSKFKILWLFLTAPFAVTKGLFLNRHKRGPLLPYLIRRLKPFLKDC